MRQKRKQILTITRLLAALWLAVGFGGALPALGAGLVEDIVTDPLTGVALEGYDPVSYFTDAEPVLGSPDYAYEWGGVPWYFTSPANRDVFALSPEIYAPQFGGHCLVSMSRGFMSDGKPRLYAIRDMKLYLFYSVANREAFFASGDGVVAKANGEWKKLREGLAGPGGDVVDVLKSGPSEPAH